MAKKIVRRVRLQIDSGSAKPSPPVGPAIGQTGVPIMEFCKAFNAATKDMEKGIPVPTTVICYNDKSFTFTMSQPPVSFFLKSEVGIKSGSKLPGKESCGSISRVKIREIAEKKLCDMGDVNIKGAMRMVEGSAISMGIDVVD
ncbi:50S ribosomal protein L11 [Candidatus Liberibacter americanus]|uniref:Large ribosomal subunit protein uL11 n=2 Tax=Candidatus Liberibacter americanus TaxID=309868 RepID=U6B7H6_9HYPH|nr:50S ribosomal protein L11 [Candidatus Liberibacter americanus]ABO40216.1 50S ribosomal subunit protein L11 [Candidatus Liberibacter americanus]AHA27816.1 Ribosomal protein L11 [Candidatus Liberibacter americanus str. Sao Paulo]EMS35983.1 50S ribosomal protein L11 [Candidatus Liberibacter americanus PW_SP]